ncbi:MAG: class III poly(R)-hydroxyalkanoic acid synthase subunit PhaC [Immundisolibacter sp.]|uniref:alpha/beta fold hydrolase n=1 Tax=Immundisolibacter sp. TaxID=1934948 RepID=UPI001988B47C|nr:alpha/beta fold hydrolase [Immundisolibacter sp.]MBC7162288.1 class III poly(R)-hydroxyalkanoic acid synthase subunit PhaC [Immundisolibacter sp.]
MMFPDLDTDAVRAQRERIDAMLAAPAEPVVWADRSAERLSVEGKASLRYYPPLREPAARPLLLVYSLVNSPQVLDLARGSSIVECLQGLGHPLYLLDWGRPDASDAGLSLADYVCGYLHGAVQVVQRHAAAGTVDLLGICQGGTLALCLASLEPRALHRLVTLVTPVDFHTPGDVLAHLARVLDLPALLAPDGNLPGAVLAAVFALLRPLRGAGAVRAPWLDGAVDAPRRERLRRLLAWQGDYPDQAGRAWLEFVTGCYRDNALVRGALVLDGRTVDLSRLRLPILNVHARADHLVPPAASQALRRAMGGRNYRELAVDGGHVGVFAGSHGLAIVPPAVSRFLRASPKRKPR